MVEVIHITVEDAAFLRGTLQQVQELVEQLDRVTGTDAYFGLSARLRRAGNLLGAQVEA